MWVTEEVPDKPRSSPTCRLPMWSYLFLTALALSVGTHCFLGPSFTHNHSQQAWGRPRHSSVAADGTWPSTVASRSVGDKSHKHFVSC